MPTTESNLRPRRAWLGAAAGPAWRNPTVWLFTGSLAVLTVGVAGYALGRLPPWATVLINSLGLYCGFTVLHDGVHGVAHPNRRAGAALARVWGFLLTFTFPFFRSIHLEHHAHTNDRRRDPDVITARLPAAVVPVVGGFVVFANYHWHYFRRRLWRRRREMVEVVACDAFYLGVLVASFAGGWTRDLMILWVGPLILTLLFLVLTFDFLPHRPHDTTDRRFNARAYGGPLVAALFWGQNYHLIHHLWPRIPWFRYRRVFCAMEEHLRSEGCRVGWKVTPLPATDRHHRRAAGRRLKVPEQQIGGDLS